MLPAARWSGGSQVRAQAVRVRWMRCERQGVEWQGMRKAAKGGSLEVGEVESMGMGSPLGVR